MAALIGSLSFEEVKAIQLKSDNKFIDIETVDLGHSSDEEEAAAAPAAVKGPSKEELAKQKAAAAKAKADAIKAAEQAKAVAMKVAAEAAAEKASWEAAEAAKVAKMKAALAKEAEERAAAEKAKAEADAKLKAEHAARVLKDTMSNMGDTEEIIKLRATKKTVDDVLFDMKVDDVAKTLPTLSPTIAAAGAAGIEIGEEVNENDPNTGLKKKVEIPPAMSDEVVNVSDTTVVTDSTGNIILKKEPTKEELLAAETAKILRKRKAEAMAEKYNSEVEE